MTFYSSIPSSEILFLGYQTSPMQNMPRLPYIHFRVPLPAAPLPPPALSRTQNVVLTTLRVSPDLLIVYTCSLNTLCLSIPQKRLLLLPPLFNPLPLLLSIQNIMLRDENHIKKYTNISQCQLHRISRNPTPIPL